MSPAWLLPPKKVSPAQHGLRFVALLLATPAFYLVFTPATPHWQWLGQGLYALQALLWWGLLQPHRWPHANLRWWRSYGLEWTLMIGALLFRFGLAAESYAWASIFVIQPISGVWYPGSVLPAWLQPLAWCLPSTYVFEGMRAVVIDKTFRWDLLAGAFALNLVYMAFAFAAFLYAFALARRRGQLLQSSE